VISGIINKYPSNVPGLGRTDANPPMIPLHQKTIKTDLRKDCLSIQSYSEINKTENKTADKIWTGKKRLMALIQSSVFDSVTKNLANGAFTPE